MRELYREFRHTTVSTQIHTAHSFFSNANNCFYDEWMFNETEMIMQGFEVQFRKTL